MNCCNASCGFCGRCSNDIEGPPGQTLHAYINGRLRTLGGRPLDTSGVIRLAASIARTHEPFGARVEAAVVREIARQQGGSRG